MSKLLCVYHGNCADGFGAAWAVREYCRRHDIPVEFHAGMYGAEPPDMTDRRVVMVDFSYKRPVLLELAARTRSILILDHHKSAAEDLAGFPEPPPDVLDEHTGAAMKGWLPDRGIYARFDMNRSGAGLAWDHFCGGERPPLIDHIEDRDLWRFNLDGTREIQAAVFSLPYDFDVWDGIMAADLHSLRAEGAAIERKHFKDIREFIDATAHRMTIAGHDVPALNAPYFWSSDAGHIMSEGEPFAACYWRDATGTVFSLRSADDGADVSAVASLFGGGGHKHAAGFKMSGPFDPARIAATPKEPTP